MKIELEVISPETSHSFTMLAKPDKELLKQTKTIIVRGQFISKTRINTTMQIGGSKNGINFEVKGYRSDAIEEHNYFEGGWTTYHYFKKLKAQGFKEYKEYVKKAVKIAVEEYMLIKGIDVLKVKLVEFKGWG